MCMEGIEQNPVVYELMSEMAFRSDKVNLEVIGFVESFNLLFFSQFLGERTGVEPVLGGITV